MKTITIDIINEKALALLRDLEVLNLIKLHEKEMLEERADKLLKLQGSMKKQSMEQKNAYLKELRDSWE